MESDIQNRNRAPPPASSKRSTRDDVIEEGVGKTPRAKQQGFLGTGAETASRRGPGAGTEPRTGGRE